MADGAGSNIEEIGIESEGDPRSDDVRADLTTFLFTAFFMLAFLVVDILSNITEGDRFEQDYSTGHFIIFESSSVLVLLALFPVIARLVSIATPGQHDWRAVLAIHGGASIILSAFHVGAMVALRKIAFAIFYSDTYIFTDNLPRDFFYEYRKDVLVYALFAFFIVFGRQLGQQAKELAVARKDARVSKRLTLKCGGRTIWLDANNIIWAKSASNYVEIKAGDKIHLARATLASIEKQLVDAGERAVRPHRSYIVNADHIRDIAPTREGDVKITMNDETVIPGSRRYRDRLPVS